MRSWIASLALATTLAFTSSAFGQAGVERYKVKKGDTLELLAAEYYGNRINKIYIMLENGMDHDRPLKPGERLRIPVSERVTVAAGDSLEGLAESLLGSVDRSWYLAEFNGLRTDATLAIGQELVIPLRVRYRAKGNEKVRDIALSFFADAKQASLLRKYNNLSSAKLEAGQVLSIPVPKLDVQPAKRRQASADAKQRAETRAKFMALALKAMPSAQNAWRGGRYRQVIDALTKLDLDYLDASTTEEAGVLLGSAYVAVDDNASARATFRKVQERSPGYTLQPSVHSPTVREVWERAQDDVE